MKIGLLTTHNAINYGALMQTFATYEYLSKNHEVKIVNYFPEYIKKDRKIVRFGFSLKRIAFGLYDIKNINHRKIKLKNFTDFSNQFLKLTDEYSFEDLMVGKCEKFDLYVSGSDQIWNPRITDGRIDPVYFAQFAEKDSRIISYGSSMGNYKFSEVEEEILIDYLSCYEKITVREDHAKTRLTALGLNCKMVLDPVFLLSKCEWINKFNLTEYSRKNKKYIFVFSLREISSTLESVKKFNSGEYEIITPGPIMGLSKIRGITYVNNMGPVEFLKLLYNAETVITNSFHGTSLSVLFNKKFITLTNAIDNTRSENLLSNIGLKDQIMSLDELEMIEEIREINFDISDVNLNVIIAESKKILDLMEDGFND